MTNKRCVKQEIHLTCVLVLSYKLSVWMLNDIYNPFKNRMQFYTELSNFLMKFYYYTQNYLHYNDFPNENTNSVKLLLYGTSIWRMLYPLLDFGIVWRRDEFPPSFG